MSTTQRTGQAGPVVSESVDLTIDFAEVAAATADDQSFAVQGAAVGDGFIVTPLGEWPDGLGLPQGRCAVAGTVIFRLCNPTVAPVNPGSQLCRVHIEHA